MERNTDTAKGRDLIWAGLSDTGPTRDHNEDAFAAVPLAEVKGLRDEGDGVFSEATPGALFMVSDGVGGSSGGEVASRLAVRAVAENLRLLAAEEKAPRNPDKARLMERAIVLANGRVRQEASAREGLKGMAATLSALWVLPGKAFVGQVGDSRIYRWREGTLEQLTHDQSEVGRLVRSGKLTEEEALGFPRKNVIDQAIGSKPEEFTPQTDWFETRPGDVFLLCSDGLVENWVTRDLAEQLDSALREGGGLRDACARIVETSKEASGKDNITLMLVRIGAEENEDTSGEVRVRFPFRAVALVLATALATAALFYLLAHAPADARSDREIEELTSRLEAREEALAGWRDTSGTLEEDLDKAGALLEERTDENAELRAELERLLRSHDETLADLETLRSERNALEADLNRANRVAEESRAALADSETRLSEAEGRNAVLESRVASLESELLEVTERMETLESRAGIDEQLLEGLLTGGESEAPWSRAVRGRHTLAWSALEELLAQIETQPSPELDLVTLFRDVLEPPNSEDVEEGAD